MRRIGWVLIMVVLFGWYLVFWFAAFYWPQTNTPSYVFWAFAGCLVAFSYFGRVSFLTLGLLLVVGYYYFDRLYLGDGLGVHEHWVPFMHVVTIALAGWATYLRKNDQ